MGQALVATQIRLTISCILEGSHLPTHSRAPLDDTDANVIGLAEQAVTHAIVVLSA